MPLRNAEITRHAWLRFLQRWEGEPPECYRTELERLIAMAVEVNLGYASVVRAIKNGFVAVRYFEVDFWRLVANEDTTTIITIERPYLKNRRVAHNKRHPQNKSVKTFDMRYKNT